MMIQERLFPATSMPDQDWWQALWPDPDSVVRSLRIEPGMTVVDLGCGDGYFTAAIARQVGPGRTIGFDLDPAMLEQAKAVCDGIANCDWLLGDAMELSRLIASSLSDLKEIGCKSAWPVHISPLFWSIERLLPCKTRKICPRPAEFSLRFFKSGRLLAQ